MDLQPIIDEMEGLRASIEDHVLLALRGVDPEEQIGAVCRDLERINQIAQKMNDMKP